MKHSDFVKLVAQMREAQKRYFDQRSRSALELSKQLEKRVDAALLEMSNQSLQQDSLLSVN